MKHGFSLVELSIVLVILGLLTGGILAGQNLIRAAELRSVSTDIQRFTASVHTFRDKYFAIPGDFKDATKFWGRQLSAGHCVTNSAQAVVSTGVCDGSGNGRIESAGSAAQAAENVQLWRHLAKAGLVEGDYTGLIGASNSDMIPGVNVARSKVGQGAYYLQYWDNSGGGSGSAWYSVVYGNAITFGAKLSTGWPDDDIVTPEEAWNIDTKMDDGMPGQGKVMASEVAGCTTSANALDFAGEYALSSSVKDCGMRFLDIM